MTLLIKDNVLLRGCMLRNTDFVEGIVIYAGENLNEIKKMVRFASVVNNNVHLWKQMLTM